MSRRRSIVISVLLALTVLWVFLALVLVAIGGPPPQYDSTWVIPFLAFSVVGAVIARKRPDHRMGWLFCLLGFGAALELLTEQYSWYALVSRPGALPAGVWAAWLSLLVASPVWLLLLFALLLFPTGNLPSRRWRPVAWLGAALMVLASSVFALKPGQIATYPVSNPVGIEGASGLLNLADSLIRVALIIFVLCCLAVPAIRYRRANGVEREQLKWVAYAACFAGTTGVLLLGLTTMDALPSLQAVLSPLAMLSLIAIPVMVGIAILRYRLYDIDIIIRRTLIYGVLTVALAGIYFGVVVLLRAFLFRGQSSHLAIVASTIAIYALFQPLRRRIQWFIDRRFYRRKYDAARTLADFGARLRDEVELDGLKEDLLLVVEETLQPAHVGLWLKQRGH